MSRDADFLPSTRELLKKRAGNHCSFPNCYAPTDGPSEEGPNATSSNGMACHIIAASSGPAARRVVSGMTPEQLQDPSNGIWMCYTHGKLIDTDEAHYTIPMLRTWKQLAELRAHLAQKHGWSREFDPVLFSDIKFPQLSIPIPSLTNINSVIGNVMHDSCVATLWGMQLADCARVAFIEIARNAFEHGGATNLQFVITPLSIRLTDNGNSYNCNELLRNEGRSGGTLSVKELFDKFGSHLYFSSISNSDLNLNEIALVRSIQDVKSLTTCTIEVSLDDFRENVSQLHVSEDCHNVYVIFPDFCIISDVLRLPTLVAKNLPQDKNYIFVGTELSAHVIEILSEEFPSARVINFDLSRKLVGAAPSFPVKPDLFPF